LVYQSIIKAAEKAGIPIDQYNSDPVGYAIYEMQAMVENVIDPSLVDLGHSTIIG
jgi:hypothetical protein